MEVKGKISKVPVLISVISVLFFVDDGSTDDYDDYELDMMVRRRWFR